MTRDIAARVPAWVWEDAAVQPFPPFLLAVALSVCAIVLLLLQTNQIVLAQGSTAKVDAAETLLHAKTATVIGYGPEKEHGLSSALRQLFTGVQQFADVKDQSQNVEKNVEKWSLFRIVSDPQQADVVLVVAVWNRNAPVDRVGGRMLVLKGGPLWSDQPQVLWESDDLAAHYGVSNPLTSKLKKYLKQIGRQELK